MTIRINATKTLLALAAGAAALTALPAAAQSYRDHDRPVYSQEFYARGDRQVNNRIENIRERIVDGKRSSRLSYREAMRLQTRLENINDDKVAYMRSGRGIDTREKANLLNRLDALSADVRYQARDGNRG